MSDASNVPAGADPSTIFEAIRTETSQVLVGADRQIEHLTIALLTRGHVLLEGVPGVAKTTMATLFARVTGLESRRIQLTPDILPADITGTHVYRESTGEFELQRGPVFTNVVIADEINRATPKAQSALLEAMQERQVSLEGDTLALPTPFMVVATQNPIEMEGVFELPEAQRDRFSFKLTVDLPDRSDERAIVDRFAADPTLGPAAVEPVVSPVAIESAREAVESVHVAEPITEYILDLVAASREHPDVAHGASPRATLAFVDGAKARAAIYDRSYVIPDDVKSIAEPTLVHRLVLETDATLSSTTGATIVDEILADVSPPGATPETLTGPDRT
ncbi:MoxR-like ATPase [Halovivax ruber XH-70]|uniref:MoxR-like ATPase n=1 Tax=Halovivax ruber (strain DSM 18193 / JCM 13892 / XH-70) TaxID=797302 RepID=L0IGU7_HALRX|nr:MoxR family ATPase [Halovivax ruber]AGB17446.1 MoxR-like ATPase [Halovivax ruber XH-70]